MRETTPPYLRQEGTGAIYIYTPTLAARRDMRPYYGEEAKEPQPIEVVVPDRMDSEEKAEKGEVQVNPFEEQIDVSSEEDLQKLGRNQLRSVAKDLGLKTVATDTKEDIIRTILSETREDK
jgi:hypothetical protein